MSQFRFCDERGADIAPNEWLRKWAALYPSNQYYEDDYSDLISKHMSLSAADFERIGKWKDGAKTQNRWKPNVASVAYPIWMQAVSELPVCPREDWVAAFLSDWSERKYKDSFPNRTIEKRFGLSRATTLLHFISGGHFPIVDARVRNALTRLLGCHVSNTISWYLDSYCPLLSEIAAACGTDDLRMVDKALFSYGSRIT